MERRSGSTGAKRLRREGRGSRFRYRNNLEIPTEWERVNRRAEAVGDTEGRLIQAWARDQADRMDQTQPLPGDLPSEIRTLTLEARFGFWRWHRGTITHFVPSDESPLRPFLVNGRLPESNASRLSLRDFFQQLEDRIVGENEGRRSEVRGMIRAAIYAQRGWQPHPDSAINRLLTALRDSAIEEHGGQIPMQGEIAISQDSPLRPFLATANWPSYEGRRACRREPFLRSLRDFLTQNGTDPELANRLVNDAGRAAGW